MRRAALSAFLVPFWRPGHGQHWGLRQQWLRKEMPGALETMGEELRGGGREREGGDGDEEGAEP